MKEKNGTHNGVTTVTFLNRAQIDYLDKLGKDCMFKYGHKLSRSKILSELVSLLMRLNISADDVELDKGPLLEGILKAIKGKKDEKN